MRGKRKRSRMMSRALALGSLNGALPAKDQASCPAPGNGSLTSHPGSLAMVVALVVALVVAPVMVVAMVVGMMQGNSSPRLVVGISMMQGNSSSITRKSHGRKATRIPGRKIRGTVLKRRTLQLRLPKGQRGSSHLSSKPLGRIQAHQSLLQAHLQQKQRPYLILLQSQCPKVLAKDPLQV